MGVCGNCNNYTGEECNYGPCEGSEKYDDSEACDFFEPIEGAKNTEQANQPDTSCKLSKCQNDKQPDKNFFLQKKTEWKKILNIGKTNII